MILTDLTRRIAMAGTAAFASLALSGCFLLPGTFDSDLDLAADGAFTFTYDGEITLFGLQQLLSEEKKRQRREEEEMARPCYDWIEDEPMADEADVTISRYDWEAQQPTFVRASYQQEPEAAVEVEVAPPPPIVIPAPMESNARRVERECTADELAARKERMESRRSSRSSRNEEMAAVFGGLDLTDPDIGEQVAELMRKQEGWSSVEHKGDGLFEVRYAITSNLQHNFAFPAIEGLSNMPPLLSLYRRQDGAILIDAPGLQGVEGETGTSPKSTSLLAMMARSGSRDFPGLEDLPAPDGTFTLSAQGTVLANNSADGFVQNGDRASMVWEVGKLGHQAPRALIQLQP